MLLFGAWNNFTPKIAGYGYLSPVSNYAACQSVCWLIAQWMSLCPRRFGFSNPPFVTGCQCPQVAQRNTLVQALTASFPFANVYQHCTFTSYVDIHSLREIHAQSHIQCLVRCTFFSLFFLSYKMYMFLFPQPLEFDFLNFCVSFPLWL